MALRRTRQNDAHIADMPRLPRRQMHTQLLIHIAPNDAQASRAAEAGCLHYEAVSQSPELDLHVLSLTDREGLT